MIELPVINDLIYRVSFLIFQATPHTLYGLDLYVFLKKLNIIKN